MEFFNLEVQAVVENTQGSIARVALSGTNAIIVNHKSDMFYFVESGNGVMLVDDTLHYLSPRSTVDIPAGTPYQDQSNGHEPLVMLSYAYPPFDPNSVETI